MKGVNAYQLPQGIGADAMIVDIGGFAYLYLPTTGVFINLEAVSAKFKSFEDLDKYIVDKGVSTWLRPSQST